MHKAQLYRGEFPRKGTPQQGRRVRQRPEKTREDAAEAGGQNSDGPALSLVRHAFLQCLQGVERFGKVKSRQGRE